MVTMVRYIANKVSLSAAIRFPSPNCSKIIGDLRLHSSLQHPIRHACAR
jgi:hypothetical protein